MPSNKTFVKNVTFYAQLIAGAAIAALTVVLFLGPADIAPTGVTGIGVIANVLIGTPIGVLVILLNIPVMILGYKMLPGGWYMVGNAWFLIIIYSVLVDVFDAVLTIDNFSDDRMLNALFGAMLWGLSSGIVFRVGVNFGGTQTLALILRRKFGLPLSTTNVYSDAVVIVGAALTFGVEGALYALLVLFISAMVADYVMEGPAVVRTAFIITNKPRLVSKALMENLYVGVTKLDGQGMYTGKPKSVLYVTISRAQAPDLRNIVTEIDDKAFLVVGQGHAAYGGGFKPLTKDQAGIKPKIPQDISEDEALPVTQPSNGASNGATPPQNEGEAVVAINAGSAYPPR